MRSIDEFKRDREMWNRETAKKQRIRLAIGWTVTVVVLIVAATVGWKVFMNSREQQSSTSGQSQEIQTPGTGA